MRADTIVGYTYQAEILCTVCTVSAVAHVPRTHIATLNPEETLDAHAQVRGIDRLDEDTFDSGDFPKVVFADMLNDTPNERCGACGERLLT